jgi:cobalt-zinc-cadmium resistance protein CzcA
VVLRDDAERRGEALVEAMRAAVEPIPGIVSSFTTPMQMRIDEGLAGTPADISVKIFGPDLQVLQRIASRAESVVRGIKGLTDIRWERVVGAPQIRISMDREACNRFGIEVGEAAETVSGLIAGKVVSTAWVGPRRYDVVVRLASEARETLPVLRSLRMDIPYGGTVPLSEIARIEEGSGYSAISREGLTRRMNVDASVEGSDLGSVASAVKEALDSRLDLPQGYFFTIGGRVESQEKAQRAMVLAVAFAGLAILVLLYLALDSLLETLVILGTLPDAFVGGILALWLTGGTWNVSSLVGLIGLFGIAVQNGLVLISQTKHLLSAGVPFESALREASVSRVRPKILTASTAILGLLPLVVFDFRGSELERPLAIVMIGGLITSTIFTLLALPTFYEWVHRWTGKQ